MTSEQSLKLTNTITEYDRKQSKRKYYNPYALGHYCEALQRVRKHCENGANLRIALLNCFNGRLLDCLLKSVKLPISTTEEQKYGMFEKLPELD